MILRKSLAVASIRRKEDGGLQTAIVLGSGGHTTEMIRLISAMDQQRYSKKTFFVAQTDNFSLEKVKACSWLDISDYEVVRIPRSREVKQSWVTTVWTTALATAFTITHWRKIGRTDLLLVNGPGTCVPICLIAWLINFAKWLVGPTHLPQTKIVFVESICRVKTLSLTGKILTRFADHLLVQWPKLAAKILQPK